jgi:hypothetical protein
MDAEAIMESRSARWIDVADESITIARATRLWVQYGIFGFAVFCIVIGAVESLFGR